ncbi:MAG: iron ABC transporter substrate-binding protein [Burkholderiaceae bacterium]|nr:iron ABC transporter substrate-binding protein [Burkholderiaceae bacterium]
MKRRDSLRWLGGMGLAAGVPGLGPWAWAAGTVDVIAARFGDLPAPERVQRVFAAGAPAGVLLAVLAPSKLLGWPFAPSDAARAMLAPALRDLPFLGRLAGRGSTIAVEKLLQLRPDLILDAGSADATYISAARALHDQTGLPCVLTHGRLPEQAAQLRTVGRMVGEAQRGERLAAYAESVLALADRVLQSTPTERRPRVYFARSADGLETGLAGSINVEVIEACGGRNVAAAVGKGSLARVSLEQILAWDPQVIVTQEPAFARLALQDPSWKAISAVREGRVHCAPTLPFGWLDGPPSVNRVIGVRWLVERLHPQHSALKGLEPMAQAVQSFYRLFYGVELSAAAAERLLRGEG